MLPRAELRVSMRLVTNMKDEKIVKLVRAFLKKRHPDVRVEAGASAVDQYQAHMGAPPATLTIPPSLLQRADQVIE